MSDLLRVLIVEDSEDDALLLVHEFQRGGYTPVFERVHAAGTMRAALAAQTWDVITSDHAMPRFSAAEALAICRQKALDIPFIIVSGRIGEASAVEMMKAGAHDYVPKDDLARLAPAMRRELSAAQERRIRRQNEATMTHLASIVESCDDAIISKTLAGTILSWNPGAERMYGHTAEEMIGRSISLLVPPGQMDDLAGIYAKVRRGERLERLETVRVRKDGKLIDVSVTVSPLRDARGQVVGASIVARDITQRRRQEQERLRLIRELTDALARVKTLSGLLPICASCKKIRNDEGYWEQVETYIKNRSQADFTHGICPECRKRLYPQYTP